MIKEKLLYDYTYNQYLFQLDRKKEIRRRSSFYIGFGFPIAISFVISSIQNTDELSKPQAILLLVSGILLIGSIFSFLKIYLPSKQKTYYPSQIINEVDGLGKSEEEINYVNFKKNENQKIEAEDYLGYRFFANMYSELYQLYESTHLMFKYYFISLALSLSISFILIAISFVV